MNEDIISELRMIKNFLKLIYEEIKRKDK